jgi:MFS family permease
MTVLMAATPLAMHACGFTFNDGATVIQLHSLAMFLPSFFTGHLINRFGVLRIIATGAILQFSCFIIALSGIEYSNFLLANLLVGLGWNFTFIGGSTLLTTTYRPSERAKVQASHDFIVYAMTALAAGVAGYLHAKAGWNAVNVLAIPFTLLVMAAAWWLAMRLRPAVAQPG